jgi:thioredoxin 1
MGSLSCWKETKEGNELSIELKRDNYEEEVLGSREPVIVDFWGPQCRPCLALVPILERIGRDYAGRLKVTKVNATENRMLCARLRVMGLPTFLFYKGGVEVNRLSGEQIKESDLVKAIDALIG